MDTRNYVVRLLAYAHRRRQNENILLMKRSYKYYSILSHYAEPQYTQTFKSLNKSFYYLNSTKTLCRNCFSQLSTLFTKLDTSSKLRACIYRQNFASKVKKVVINFKSYSSKILVFQTLNFSFSFTKHYDI